MSEPYSLRFTIAEDPPNRLDKALARDVPEQAALSRSRLARLIAEGAVALDGGVALDPKAKVTAGQEVEITLEPATELDLTPENIPLDVVYEDAELIVVNKPAGMVVHPAPGAMRGTLVHALLHHCGDSLSGIGGEKRPGIVHRIDKETSGILVVAKTDRAHHGLAAQFEAHSAEREYRAFAFGVPDVGDPRLAGLQGVGFEPSGILKLTTELGRHRTDRQRQAVMFSGGRRAVTRARVVQSFGTPPAISELRCWLETGRTHQIRVHLAYAGHGLLGDPVYGGRRKLPKTVPEPVRKVIDGFGRQALHAAVLGLIHPVSGEKLRFEADLPADMAALATALQGLA